MNPEKHTPTEDLLGGVDVHSVPELAKKASCGIYINKDIPIPPILMFHGTDDDTVPPHQSMMLYDKLKKEDKEVTFYSVQGAKHGGAMYWCSEVLDIIDAFIKKNVN